jgi:RimJ/RimL family protein N-acetyltransferase
MENGSENGYMPESEILLFERVSMQTSLPFLHDLHRDSKVMEHLGPVENVLSATRFTLQRMILENERRPDLGHWMIYHREQQECLGRISLKPLDRTNRLELQVLLFPFYWRKGLGFEAAHQVLKGFSSRPVYAIFPKSHVSATQLALKLGFSFVGPAYYYERDSHLWVLETPTI